MKSGIIPKTSQSNLVQVRELFKGYAEKSEDFVYISFSSKMSGTHQSAKLILDELKEEYPNTKMEVIDSKGCRLSRGKAVVGYLMNIKPILKIEDGEILHFKSVRGKKKATKEMINEF